MIKNVQNKQHTSAKKAYRKPQLKTLGSVRQLTLKIGSNTDGLGGNRFE